MWEYRIRLPIILIILLFLIISSLAVLTFNYSFLKKEEPKKYLKSEEVVVLSGPQGPSEEPAKELLILPVEDVLFEYVEVADSCNPSFEGDCLNVRSGPGEEYDVVTRLRNGVVLRIDGKVQRVDRAWYRVIFDEKIRYPERVKGDWYIASEYVRILYDEGEKNIWENENSTTTKRVIVNRSEQMLYAYEGNDLFMKTAISTGIELTPTPRGSFTIYKKTPSRYMQGPLPGISDKYYDLPGVPWNLYFTYQGAVIHGTYWHNNFGKPASNGCVNLPPNMAEQLYKWAEVGMQVVVQD